MSNWDKVNSLLSVIHSAAGAGPKFTKWAQKASDELETHWEESEPAPAVVVPTVSTPEGQPAQPEPEPTGDEVDPPPPNARRL